jgi:hypothetical protein
MRRFDSIFGRGARKESADDRRLFLTFCLLASAVVNSAKISAFLEKDRTQKLSARKTTAHEAETHVLAFPTKLPYHFHFAFWRRKEQDRAPV